MTKGRAALPGSVVAEQKPFLSLSKNISREGPLTPQISPLRCAPVEMTKGRAALPGSVLAEQVPFFIALGGPKAMTPPVEMTKGRRRFRGVWWLNRSRFYHCRKSFPGKDR